MTLRGLAMKINNLNLKFNRSILFLKFISAYFKKSPDVTWFNCHLAIISLDKIFKANILFVLGNDVNNAYDVFWNESKNKRFQCKKNNVSVF
jgi:hypothetical protein